MRRSASSRARKASPTSWRRSLQGFSRTDTEETSRCVSPRASAYVRRRCRRTRCGTAKRQHEHDENEHNTLGQRAYVMLVLSYACWGVFNGSVSGPLEALFGDSVETGSRSFVYQLKSALRTAGNAIGPLISIVIFSVRGDVWRVDDLSLVMFCGLALTVCPIACLFFFSDEKSLGAESEAFGAADTDEITTPLVVEDEDEDYVTCSDCGGSGEIEDECGSCGGSGYDEYIEEVEKIDLFTLPIFSKTPIIFDDLVDEHKSTINKLGMVKGRVKFIETKTEPKSYGGIEPNDEERIDHVYDEGMVLSGDDLSEYI